MKYNDLRDFIAQLEQRGELKRITVEVDPYLEGHRDLRPHAARRGSRPAVRAAQRV